MPLSDFRAARELLERAGSELCGPDELSCQMRRVVDILVEDLLTLEHRPGEAEIIPFPDARRASAKRLLGSGRT